MTTSQLSILVDAVADAKLSSCDATGIVDLVLSGPEVSGIPTSDTFAAVRKLIDSAVSEVLIVGYVIHQGRRIFERLAVRMDEVSELRVMLCLDIPRKRTDTSLPEEIVKRFAHDFREHQWPGKRMPNLFYDPRSLSESWDKRSSLHAKCMVIDRKVALVTSANFTEAAQQRNIEAGVLVKAPWIVERLVDYFEGLIADKQLIACSLGKQ